MVTLNLEPRANDTDRAASSPPPTNALLSKSVESPPEPTQHTPNTNHRLTSYQSQITSTPILDFTLPRDLEATRPPEARGLRRDGVRLMVTRRASDRIEHLIFCEIERVLGPGDLLVVNTSGTRPAALAAHRADGTELALHLSTRLASGRCVIELRTPSAAGSAPFFAARAGESIALPAGGRARLIEPHDRAAVPGHVRLWQAVLRLPAPLDAYLDAHGAPIRYGYVPEAWPIADYQTVFATERGSAEMPSAGRAFTPELVARLVARGVQFAPLTLHTGVSSLEADEPPYEERYRVPALTAELVNAARARGSRVIAVGTTAVRALETAADARGIAHASEGWTDLVVTPERGVRLIDGLLTGLHEPRASHLAMLEAIAGRAQLERAYDAALRERYLWHEFGDLHLTLP